MTSSFTGQNGIAFDSACLALLMFGLEISSMPVVLPTLETALAADFNDLQWVMNAYTIAVTTVLMATGAMADRYGRKRLFVVSIVTFGIASLACGLARTVRLLIVARVVQGASGGAMLICLIAVLSRQFEDMRERATAFAAWGVIFGVGVGFGPIVGGAIVAASNWQWVFLVHGPLTLVTLILATGGVR